MTQREKLIELLEKLTRFCISRATCQFCKYRNNAPFCINEAIADHLIENGVVLVDTNSVKRENLPLIQQAFGMPLDELRGAIEKGTPKKPILWGDGCDDKDEILYDMWDCPNCGEHFELDYDTHKHCPECGQAIDWSETK